MREKSRYHHLLRESRHNKELGIIINFRQKYLYPKKENIKKN